MSLVHHTETHVWPGIRERIIADFRDFRFSWAGFFRWTGIVIAAFLFAAIVTLYFLDWNQLRGPIGRYFSWRSGREVRIDGNLKVDLFRWQPHVSVGGLTIGNANSADPAWAGRPEAAHIGQGDVEFRLWPAIWGNWILPLVKLDHARILVMRDLDGRTNWDRSSQEAAWKIPPIRRFLVTDGHVEIEDAIRKLHFIGTVSSQEEAGSARSAFHLDGDGTLNGNKFLAHVGGGPLLNVDESKPYAFNADIHSGATHAVITGAITHPFQLGQFNAHVDFTGPNLGDLYLLTGLALPGTPPYHLSGALSRDNNFYSLTGIKGVVGASDLHGFLTVDVSGKVPDLRGHLSSRVLNFDDLGALFRGGKVAVATTDPYLLPDVTLHTEKLRELNGELDYDADAITSRDFPLRGLSTHVSVQNGVMTLKPLAFSFTEGELSGWVSIDARRNVPVTSLDARVTDLHIEHFFKRADKPLEGMVEARAQLTGEGSSVHKVGSSASGTVTAVIPSGQIRHSLAEWLGVNVISALGLTLSGDQSNTNIRCAVAHFSARDGVLTAQQFVFDTDPVRMDGHGTVNMKDETLDLTLQGKPKSFQILHVRAPITVTGKMASPSLGFDAKPAIVQGAIGAGLAVANPFAAILAFIDPGMAKNANCADALTVAKTQGAPVKQSAVAKAAASDAAKK